ncbi:MAG: hypothetical protein GY827_00615 [Cytophagales bacterium]|nr:hypothetical protein [Cytophagales bacterium]
MRKLLYLIISTLLCFPLVAQEEEEQGYVHISINNPSHTGHVNRMHFDAKNNWTISVGEDKSIILWNTETQKFHKKYIFNYDNGIYGTILTADFFKNQPLVAFSGIKRYEKDSTSTIVIFDYESGRVVSEFKSHLPIITSIDIGSNEKSCIASGERKIEVINLQNMSSPSTSYVIEREFPINHVAFNQKQNKIFFSEGKILYWIDAKANEEERVFHSVIKHYKEITDLAVSDDSSYVVTGGRDHLVNLFDQDGKFIRKIDKLENTVSDLTISHDGQVLVSFCRYTGKGYSFALPSGELLSEFKEFDNSVFSSEFLNNAEGVYTVLSAGGKKHQLKLWNALNGSQINELGDYGYAPWDILFNNDLLYISEDKNDPMFLFHFDFAQLQLTPINGLHKENLANYKKEGKLKDPYTLKIRKTKFHYEDERILSWLVHNEYVFIGGENSLKQYDLNGNLVREFSGHNESVRSISLDPTRNYLISGGEDHILNIYNLNTGEKPSFLVVKTLEPMLKMHVNNKMEWVLWSKEGYFTGSENAGDLMAYQTEADFSQGKFISAEQFFDVLFQPEVIKESYKNHVSVKSILENKGERVLDLANLQGPSFSLFTSAFHKGKKNGVDAITYFEKEDGMYKTDFSSATLELECTDGGGGIKEISIYQNGKLVILDTESPKTGAMEQVKRSYDVSLLPGTNTFKVITTNFQKRTSFPDEISIQCNGQINATSKLFVIAVGINKYENTKYNLNYAYIDASSFVKKIRNVSGKIFNEIVIEEVYNEQATKAEIAAAFEKVQKLSSPNDVCIFYYAGHGVINSEVKDAEYYLVPTEVTTLYGDEDLLKKKAISTTQLKVWLTNIKAQKQLILLDACHSGGAVKALAYRGAPEEKAIFQLARSSGTVLISASESQQFAVEFNQLGHGVFTYALLKGLDGEADGGNKDQKITVNELKAYMEDLVPQLSQKYGGVSQYPTGFSTGQDFPIGTHQKVAPAVVPTPSPVENTTTETEEE